MENNKATTKRQRGIYIESKPTEISTTIANGILPGKYRDAQHLYLLYEDGNGNNRIIRGGPKSNQTGRNLLTGGASRIEVQKDIPLEQSHDKYEDYSNPSTRYSKKLDIPDTELDNTWEKMLKSSEKIDNLGIRYRNPNGDEKVQNSNSTIRTILEENNLKYDNYVPEEVRSRIPGYETDLLKDPRLTKHIEFDKDTPQLMDEEEAQRTIEHSRREAKERELFELMKKNNDDKEDFLYKKSEDVTEDEVRNASKFAMFDAPDSTVANRYRDRIKQWYSSVYSDNPQSLDATGRPIEPQPKRAIAYEPKALQSKDGFGIFDAYKNIGSKIAGLGDGVKTLQRSINSFGIQPQLKEDGVLGPKTTSQLKNSLVNYGQKPLENKILELDGVILPSRKPKEEESEDVLAAQSNTNLAANSNNMMPYRRKQLI